VVTCDSSNEAYEKGVFYKNTVMSLCVEVREIEKLKFEIRITNDGKLTAPVSVVIGKFWTQSRRLKEFVRDIVYHSPESPLSEDDFKKKVSEIGIELDEQFKHYVDWLCQKIDSEFLSKSGVNGASSVGCVTSVVDGVYRALSKQYIQTSIHPTIDVYNNELWVGMAVPIEADNNTAILTHVLVSSTGRLIPVDRVDEYNMRLRFMPAVIEPRWSARHIVYFVEHFTTPNPTLPALDTQPTPENEQFEVLKAGILKRIEEKFSQYVELAEGDESKLLLSLWCIGTYFHRLFKAYPYMLLNGPKASGKTRTLEVVQQIAFNSILSAGMSTASLFRLIENLRPTMLIDEGEALYDKERKEGFREVLLSGYRNGAKTYRVEESSKDGIKQMVVKEFDLYSPKMLANIQGLEDVLESRCISIVMKPALDQEIANRELDIDDPDWISIRDDIYFLLMKSWKEIKQHYKETKNDGTFRNREWELWHPMIALARFFGADKQATIMEYAKEKVEESRMEETSQTTDHIILRALLDNALKGDGYYSISDIRTYVGRCYDTESDIPQWMTPSFIGRVLKRLGFRDKRRIARGVEVRIPRVTLEDLAIRMGMETVTKKPVEFQQGSLNKVI
jgi:hypothetical protein